jgi:hypothetical protein
MSSIKKLFPFFILKNVIEHKKYRKTRKWRMVLFCFEEFTRTGDLSNIFQSKSCGKSSKAAAARFFIDPIVVWKDY